LQCKRYESSLFLNIGLLKLIFGRLLGVGKIQLNIIKLFFTSKPVKHWNRLPGEGVQLLFLEFFKMRLDKALSPLI